MSLDRRAATEALGLQAHQQPIVYQSGTGMAIGAAYTRSPRLVSRLLSQGGDMSVWTTIAVAPLPEGQLSHSDEDVAWFGDEEAKARDREWFAARPSRNHRLRRPGELERRSFPPPDDPEWDQYTAFAVVHQVSPGYRVRLPVLLPGLPPDNEDVAKEIFDLVLSHMSSAPMFLGAS